MGTRIIVQFDLEENVTSQDEIASFEEYVEQTVNLVNGWTNYAAKIVSGSERYIRELVVDSAEYKELCVDLHKKYEKDVESDPGGDYPQAYWDEFNPRFEAIMAKYRDIHKGP